MVEKALSNDMPQIRYEENGNASLFVDGKEFFILGGETHISVH